MMIYLFQFIQKVISLIRMDKSSGIRKVKAGRSGQKQNVLSYYMIHNVVTILSN